MVEGVFAEEIRHPLLGTIHAGTVSTEWYWSDRWFSVFRFTEPSGALRNYYCNINTPVRLEGERLSFVDLDVDVLVAPDFTYRVLDEDEFERHEKLYQYPPEFRRRVSEALAEALELIRLRRFPFDEADTDPRVSRVSATTDL